jgi:multidrug efflux pump
VPAVFSRFFIDRPIFASVLSVFITLAGAISAFNLPLAQFPQISPPTVSVTCQYPGASAKDVAESVAAPIEQQVNGVEGMMYMSSSSTNDGSYSLTVTFEHGIDLNMAQVLVENRVNLAVPMLPTVIKQTGVTTRKRSPDILMGMSLNSADQRYNQLYLSNYALLQIRDELLRIEGVADVFLFGQRDYSMRIWVDPDRLAARGLNASDVALALREQNAQLAAGSIGQQPVRNGQELQITLNTLGRLAEVEQFENIILRTTPDGRVLRLKDVARVELGSKNQDVSVNFDGKETIFLAVFQMPDANALDTHDRVVKKMRELEKKFPAGLKWEIAFDTTPYTSESIKEVVKTLRDAVILVSVVVLLFLQNWRSAIIPLIAVPVAIIGTFAVMLALGFSLNNLTLFGLVLAIGIVVDDAIVVVEAVEHHIEHGLAPREATYKAMEQVSGPVIAVGLVLSAVFVPCAFISGITGHFFRQFALTISVSTIISAFNSLTLSPALTALLLKPRDKVTAPPLPRVAFALAGGWLSWLYGTAWLSYWLGRGAEYLPATILASVEPFIPSITASVIVVLGAAGGWLVGGLLNRTLGWFFRTFNAGFGLGARAYLWTVGGSLRFSVLMLAVYGGLVWITIGRFRETPKGFIPSQDMGYLMVSVQLPDSASSERTDIAMRELQNMALKMPGIRHATAIRGQSFVLNAYGSNFGSMFINLKDYEERRDPTLSAEAIARKLMMQAGEEVFDAQVAVFPPPPVRGAGRAGGFAFMVEDRGDLGSKELQNQTENLVRRAVKTPGIANAFSVFRANVPQLHIEADPRECLAKGVRLTDFADTLAIYQGSLYVNDFNLFGRTWEVIVQADSPFRDEPEDLARLKVRNRNGGMVPLGSLASVREINGPLVLTRYNMYPAASINGSAAPGMSSFDAIALMQKLATEEFPRGMAYEWTDMSYLEVKSGDDASKIFGFAVLMVFLVLAFQYENWSLPLAVILVVPMCLLSAIIGVNLAGMDINIFTRIGFVVLVGLASKNAILIVEFAKVQRTGGMPRRQAALEACKLRLRPIIMTSLAFVLGVLPLMISHGAGFEMRRTLGTAVFSGMLGVTLFGIFLTPIFFYTIDSLGESRLFASRFMRTVNFVSIEALRAVRPRRVVALLRGHSRAVTRVEVPGISSLDLPVTNGAAAPNGNINLPPAHLRESVKQK